MRFQFGHEEWEIEFRHQRYTREEQKITRRAGETVCLVKKASGLAGYYGVAACSRKDPFNKKVGRELALERAIQTAPWEIGSLAREAYEDRLRG